MNEAISLPIEDLVLDKASKTHDFYWHAIFITRAALLTFGSLCHIEKYKTHFLTVTSYV